MVKRGILLVLAALLLVGTVSAIELTETINPVEYMRASGNPNIISLKYEPYPVEPGEYFNLWAKVENMGDTAKNITCILAPEYPFSIDETATQSSYGTVAPSDQIVLEYNKIRVDENAVEGANELKIRCSPDPFGYWIEKNFTIQIQTRYPTLNIKAVRTEPAFVEPGSNAKLIITLENDADTSMKDVTITLNLTDVSFAPYAGINDKELRRINSGQTTDVVFDISALPEAVGGIHKIPMVLSYTDELGNAFSRAPTVAVEVNSKPDLYVAIDSTTMTASQKSGTVTIKVVNKGLTNIKFMDVQLLETEDIKIYSSDRSYIGSVDSDDFETADFKISTKTASATLPLQLSYRDVNNRPYKEQVNLTLNLASAAELGTSKGTSWITIIIVLVVLLVIFIKRKAIIGLFKKK